MPVNHHSKFRFNHDSLYRANNAENKNWESNEFNRKNYDEFRLLTEMVRHERINFLQAVNKRGFFAVTQRDEYSGDNLIHYAVLSGK